MPKLSLNASKKTKHTPAGDIPVDWANYQMKDCAVFVGGAQPPQSTFIFEPKPGYVRMLQIRDYKSDKNATYIPAELSNRSCTEDDIMIGRYGPPIFQILRGKRGSYNVALIKAVPTSIVDRDYLFLLFKQDSLFRLIDTLSRRTSGQTGIDMDALKTFPIPLPPLPEQRRIADILGTWDRAIETLESIITTKSRRKDALMQQLLTGKKRVKGAKGKWRNVQMGNVLERVFRPIDWHPDLPLNLISLRRRCGGLFRRADVKGSEYKTKDLHEIRSGDFLISKRQVVHGAWSLVTPEFEGGHVSKEYAIFDNRSPDQLHMPFFAWLAQTRRMIRLARVSSTGVHIEKLIFDPKVFLSESISIPPTIEEQKTITKILDAADRELTLHRQHLATLRTQKRGLMQKLLTGEIRTSTK